MMSTAGTALRVVIAEDAAIMRDGLTQTLTRRGLDVVAAAAELFSRAPAGVGYLLKDRVADVSEFIDAITPGGAGRDGA